MSNSIKIGESVRVDWIDAAHYKTSRHGDRTNTYPMSTVGVICQLDTDTIALAQTVTHDDAGNREYRDIEVIPRPWLRKIRRLR